MNIYIRSVLWIVISASVEKLSQSLPTKKKGLLFCPLYEKEREIMRKRLSQNCGIVHFDLNVLLDTRKEDEFKDWRSAILTELETYVAETKRFAARPSYQ